MRIRIIFLLTCFLCLNFIYCSIKSDLFEIAPKFPPEYLENPLKFKPVEYIKSGRTKVFGCVKKNTFYNYTSFVPFYYKGPTQQQYEGVLASGCGFFEGKFLNKDENKYERRFVGEHFQNANITLEQIESAKRISCEYVYEHKHHFDLNKIKDERKDFFKSEMGSLLNKNFNEAEFTKGCEPVFITNDYKILGINCGMHNLGRVGPSIIYLKYIALFNLNEAKTNKILIQPHFFFIGE